MSLDIILFFTFLFLFIAGFVVIFLNRKFQSAINCILLIAILIGLVYISQKEGILRYKIGPLEATIQKESEQTTKFKLTNPTGENVKETVSLRSNSQIKNVMFSTGNEYFSIIDGGIGNNYIVYKIDIPPNTVASGSVVSADTVVFAPMLKSDDLKEKK